MASFAKAQLLKYGWTEGKGLGKNENGIVDALRPKLKFDTAGIGHDAKEYKWWESVYDKASSNVAIDSTGKSGSIAVTTKSGESIEISSKKSKLSRSAKGPPTTYGNFLKTCTLDNGAVVRHETIQEPATETITEPVELTDEQLFEACGGRTAHKGARHGLKLSGKLARIARQEAEMLRNAKRLEANKETWIEVKHKKSKKRKRRRSATEMDTEMVGDSERKDGNSITLNPCDSSSKIHESRKRNKKKRKKEVPSEPEEIKSAETVLTEEKTIETVDGAIITLEDNDDPLIKSISKNLTGAELANFHIRKKKKKSLEKKAKKRLDRLSDSLMAFSLSEDSVEPELDVESAKIMKKLKKRRRKKEIGRLKKAGIARLNIETQGENI